MPEAKSGAIDREETGNCNSSSLSLSVLSKQLLDWVMLKRLLNGIKGIFGGGKGGSGKPDDRSGKPDDRSGKPDDRSGKPDDR
ncbi:MAG: hypothetical protein KJP04_00435 [Arenicella sp.]|nr:hypothetical protein [Arenicella sp.]